MSPSSPSLRGCFEPNASVFSGFEAMHPTARVLPPYESDRGVAAGALRGEFKLDGEELTDRLACLGLGGVPELLIGEQAAAYIGRIIEKLLYRDPVQPRSM